MAKLDRLTQTLACVALVLAITRLLTGCDDTPPKPSPSGVPGKYCPTKENPNKLCDSMAPRG